MTNKGADFAKEFILIIVAVIIVVTLIPTALEVVGNLSGVPLLTVSIVGTVIAASVLFFLLEALM